MRKTRTPRQQPPRQSDASRGKIARNPRAAAQTRKILGRHYAAKYRTGRG
jgi:hypothetical protein